MVDFHDRRDGSINEIPGNPEDQERRRSSEEEREHEDYYYRQAKRDYDSDGYYDAP
jgi:hypothetical protein